MALFQIIQNVRTESGQTMAEYSIILAVVTVTVVGVLAVLDKAVVKEIKHAAKAIRLG